MGRWILFAHHAAALSHSPVSSCDPSSHCEFLHTDCEFLRSTVTVQTSSGAKSVNACLAPLCAVDGTAVTTVEVCSALTPYRISTQFFAVVLTQFACAVQGP